MSCQHTKRSIYSSGDVEWCHDCGALRLKTVTGFMGQWACPQVGEAFARIRAVMDRAELMSRDGLGREIMSVLDLWPNTNGEVSNVEAKIPLVSDPVPMFLTCPSCGARHIDEGVFATKVHHTHSCQQCGLTWRPAVVATVGVQFLPGFKSVEVKT